MHTVNTVSRVVIGSSFEMVQCTQSTQLVVWLLARPYHKQYRHFEMQCTQSTTWLVIWTERMSRCSFVCIGHGMSAVVQ